MDLEDPYGITLFEYSEARSGGTYTGGGVKLGSLGEGLSSVNMLGVGREGAWSTFGPQYRTQNTVASLQGGTQVCRTQCHDRRSIGGVRMFADVWSNLAPERALSGYFAYSEADASFGTRWRLWFGPADVRLGPEIQINDDRAALGAAAALKTGVAGVDLEISAGAVNEEHTGLGPYASLTLLRNFIIEPAPTVGPDAAPDTP